MGVHAYNVADLTADLYARIPTVDGELEILMGDTAIGDYPPTWWQWDVNSSATDNYSAGNLGSATVILPTGRVGNGRWLKRGTLPINTSFLPEVTNLYYTNARARAALSQGTGISYSNSTGVITNSSPDQTVTIGGATGTYPNFTLPAFPGATTAAAYGTGTAYTLTISSAKITFGTTSPSITIPAAGTYLLIGNVTIDYVGLTTVAVTTCNFKMRRINNTAADITNSSTNFNVPIVTLLTQTGGDADVPAVIYTTANNNDTIELWGNRGTISVGSIQITNGYILAVKIA